MKAATHNLKWYLFGFGCLRTFIIFWLVCLSALYYCATIVLHCLSTWVFSCIMFRYSGWSIFIFWQNFKKAALKVQAFWCKAGIYSWNPSKNVSSCCRKIHFQFQFLAISYIRIKYISLYFIHNSIESSCKYVISFKVFCFLKLIPGVFGRSVNLKIPKRFLCRRPVFPAYLSVSWDSG